MKVEIVECPRDAMQGFESWIPTKDKILYMNQLLSCGFDVLDCGSLVSAKAIPQMADTEEVLQALHVGSSHTKLLVIVANKKGAQRAVHFPCIDFLGFPFSVSEEFQLRNTRRNREQAMQTLKAMVDMAHTAQKKVVAYVSMAFGNPYNEAWSVEIVAHWVEQIAALGVEVISLSDTVGMAQPQDITTLFSQLIPAYPHITLGAHLHTQPHNWKPVLEAAYDAGCRRFDGAILGLGGCPMATHTLTGNLPTEHLLQFLNNRGVAHGVDPNAFDKARRMAQKTFPIH